MWSAELVVKTFADEETREVLERGVNGTGKLRKGSRKILTVNKSGVAKAKNPGKATVDLYHRINKKWVLVESREITVEKPKYKKTIKGMHPGDVLEAKDLIIEDISVKPTSWSAFRADVATVDPETGHIILKKKGVVRITAFYGTGKTAAKYKTKIRVK